MILSRTETNIRNAYLNHCRRYLYPGEFLEDVAALDRMIEADIIEEVGSGDGRIYRLTEAGVAKFGLADHDLYDYEEPEGGLDIDRMNFGRFLSGVAAHCKKDRNGCPLPPVIHEGVLWKNEDGGPCPVCRGKKYADYEYCLYCNRYGLLDNT